MAVWRWEDETRRYRDQTTGRYMARSQVMSYVEESLAASGDASGALGTLAGEGRLSPADFARLGREEIKQEYLRQYMLGRGGRAAMMPSDWGTVGQQIKGQYAYFKTFAEEVASGKLSPEQISARMKMYSASARQAYETAHEKNAKALGMDEERWLLGAVMTEHCEDCEAYMAEGWQPLGTFPEPGDGSTQCLTNCACEKMYRNSETGETY